MTTAQESQVRMDRASSHPVDRKLFSTGLGKINGLIVLRFGYPVWHKPHKARFWIQFNHLQHLLSRLQSALNRAQLLDDAEFKKIFA